MSTGGQDLFVVCKSCGAEVSPYITECPYCGNRLRKRAPKIDRSGRISDRRWRGRQKPILGPLRHGEIPGIRVELRPYATIAITVAGLVGCLLWRANLVDVRDVAIIGKPGTHWWRIITAGFTYTNTGHAFITLAAIAVYGWLLERRHGPLIVIILFAIAGVGGTLAATFAYADPVVLGASGAALAMIVAWAIPDLLELHEGEQIEGDLLGTAVFAAVVALLPLLHSGATWPADAIGLIAGLFVGLPLSQAVRR